MKIAIKCDVSDYHSHKCLQLTTTLKGIITSILQTRKLEMVHITFSEAHQNKLHDISEPQVSLSRK